MRLNNYVKLKDLHAVADNHPLLIDMVSSLLGPPIGQGTYRTVYEYALDPRLVIKVQSNQDEAPCNMWEYEIWNEAKWLTGNLEWIKNFLAPVHWISPGGMLLLMRRTEKRPNKKLPKYVPDFMTDIKEENFGWMGSRFVCHDYAMPHRLLDFKDKARTAKWDK